MALLDSNRSLGAVTRLLIDHLNRRTSFAILSGRPEDAAGGNATTLNLFLYETVFDPHLKNLPLVEGEPPPLWMTLKYLLTAFDEGGESDSPEAHEVLGQGIGALQELAFLGLDAIVAGPVREALENNPEPLKITFEECTVDLLNKITQTSDDEYRLSIAFQVRPVMIVPPERPSFNLLVGVDYTATPAGTQEDFVGLDVIPSLGPFLKSVTPGKFAIGDEIQIVGDDLDLSNLSCHLGPAELGIAAQRPDRMTVRIDAALGTGAVISAGEHPLSLRQYLPATGRSRGSNLLVGRLLPTVTSATAGSLTDDGSGNLSGDITINGLLLGRNEDSILAALYRDGAVAHTFDIIKPLPAPGDPPDPQNQMTLSIPASARVRAGSYLLLVIVNGQQARQSPPINLAP
jgi:Pvc16 N-terminal domain